MGTIIRSVGMYLPGCAEEDMIDKYQADYPGISLVWNTQVGWEALSFTEVGIQSRIS